MPQKMFSDSSPQPMITDFTREKLTPIKSLSKRQSEILLAKTILPNKLEKTPPVMKEMRLIETHD